MTIIEKYLKQFELYSGGSLEPAKKAVFEALIRKNDEVRAAWNEYCSLMEACSDSESILLRSLLEKTYNEQFPDPGSVYFLKKQWVNVAAAAIFIILIVGFAYLSFTGRNGLDNSLEVAIAYDSAISAKSSDTILNIKTGEEVYAIEQNMPIQPVSDEVASIFDQEEYQISPVFAELLHNVYRSNWFRITNPKDSTLFKRGDNIVFTWETNIEEPIYFDILDRNGIVVFKEPEAIKSPWKYSPNLPPAIYMYRFSTKDQPVWLGVIIIYC